MAPLSPTELQEKVNGWYAKIIGGVLLWIGVIGVALEIWALQIVVAQPQNVAVYLIACGFCVVTAFSLSVGWRLFLNRPNRYGSILGPIGWSILAFLFAAFGIGLTLMFGMAVVGDISLLLSIASCFGFGFWCFKLARRTIAYATKPAL